MTQQTTNTNPYAYLPPAGFAGRRVSPNQGDEIRSLFLVSGQDEAKPNPTAYGLFLVFDDSNNAFTPTKETDYDVNVKNGGFLVRDFIENTTDSIVIAPSAGSLVPVMVRGVIKVPFFGDNDPKINGGVFVRYANATAEKPLGGVEDALVSGETIQIPNASFVSNMDTAQGVVSVRLNT